MVVLISISDPWDWVTVNGGGPFAADVVAVEQDWLLARLRTPLAYAEKSNDFILVSTRHANDSYLSLGANLIPSDLLPIPTAEIREEDDGALASAIAYAKAHRRGGLMGGVKAG